MRKVRYDLSTIRNKDRTVGNINPEVVPLLIASKRNLDKVTSKCNIHTLHKLEKTILFFIQTGPALPQSFCHEKVLHEARRSQTMMYQRCVSVNLRIL